MVNWSGAMQVAHTIGQQARNLAASHGTPAVGSPTTAATCSGDTSSDCVAEQLQATATCKLNTSALRKQTHQHRELSSLNHW